MSLKQYIFLLVPALLLVATCTKREGASVDVHMVATQIGVTKVAQLAISKESPLIGFIDSRSSTVYVANGAAERVKKLFRVKEDKGSTWVLDYGKAQGEFKVASMEMLDRNRTVDASDVYAREKLFCKTYKKGTCINFYDANGKFAYSWKTSSDASFCIRSDGDCTDLPQTNKVDLFPEKDCQGTATTQEKTWMFCTPA